MPSLWKFTRLCGQFGLLQPNLWCKSILSYRILRKKSMESWAENHWVCCSVIFGALPWYMSTKEKETRVWGNLDPCRWQGLSKVGTSSFSSFFFLFLFFFFLSYFLFSFLFFFYFFLIRYLELRIPSLLLT